MSVTREREPRSATPTRPSSPPQGDLWSRRLALGLPVLALLLVLVVANQIGGVLIARDLRAQYEGLVADGEELLGQINAPQDPAPTSPPLAETAAPPDQRPQVTVAVSLTEFAVTADVAEIPAWATVTLSVTNDGVAPHDLQVGPVKTALLDPGASESLTFDAPGGGEVTLICTVAGHEAAGMTLALPITGDEAAEKAPAADHPGDAAATDEFASPENAAAYEGDKPPLELRDPAAPELPAGTVHDVTFTAQETIMQVAEGVWQEVWTFNGQAPGPTLRVKVGDTVNLTLRNPDEAKLGHSIDFHASQVAWNDEMRTIAPGEELTYSFTATHAGLFMYHCGTAPALHHIGNGMYGAIIVEPEGGLPDVDHEFVFVQGEYYTGPQGQPGDLGKMSAGAADPDYVVWNGVTNQYADHPIEVGVGERIRTWVLNAGPSADSSYHVVGTIFDTVVKEGVALNPDNPGGWGSQAIDLSPAQGGYAEFTLAEDGLYPIVTHAFNHVGRGALGLFQAGDGGGDAAAEH
ncbi:MAG TPA: multicopper oxidase domain-containing protein [Egibacteraceae bacterium]|nr:multicopper oxidase domain-containing protein [Egibacteraceae bacterium]